jgi:hypothetical protein
MTAYRDHVLTMLLADLEGLDAPLPLRQAVVLALSMQDHALTPAARCRPGDTVTIRLVAWPDVAPKYEKLDRSDLQDPDLDLIDPNWAAEVELNK